MGLERLIGEILGEFRIPLQPEVLAGLIGFMEELDRWNRKINLVGLKDIEQACRELLADAFFLYGYVANRRRLVDAGSGSGILAIPIALLNNDMTVYSVDSKLKKIQFQRHISRVLGLRNLLPVHGRIETVGSLGADGFVAKAFGATKEILTAAGRHLKEEGSVYVVKGRDEEGADSPGFELMEDVPYKLPSVGKTYRLLIYKKVSQM